MPPVGYRRPAHPRVCGENSEHYARKPRPSGSSPRVRGKRSYLWNAGTDLRLIPACAGKTGICNGNPLRPWAHPRVCGENVRVHRAWATGAGSSPRVRGKRLAAIRAATPTGLIPACAGKTPKSCRCCLHRRAHPRVCGENFMESSGGAIGKGSSPRVRGKPQGSNRLTPFRGLIPACAGKTPHVD